VKREHGKFYQKENPKKINKNNLDCEQSRSKLTLRATSSVNVDEVSVSSPIVKANPHESDAIHRFINEKAKQQVIYKNKNKKSTNLDKDRK
jgi:hypothetical protein